MATVRFNTQFPGYEILSELGRSNARILKARHLDTGDLVAIKHFALNTDPETLRRFQRESAIMTSIAHPNIVKVREVQLEAELPYIVMELIEGGSVCDLLKAQGHLDVPTTTRLGLQMAGAFRAIHAQGIVHRDVKPDNILYRPLPSGELHFLLTDFGVARLHEQSTTLTGQSLMTYEYASPEQFNDPKNVGVATDYYSLGVVLYECLTGKVPFALVDHSGIVTFMNKVLSEAPPVLTVSANGQSLGPFTPLLEGLLKKKATERLSDPDELTWLLKQAELAYLQAGRAGRVNQPTPAPTPVLEPHVVTQPQPEPLKPRVASTVKEPHSPKGIGTAKIMAFLAFALLILAGVYYITTKPNAQSTNKAGIGNSAITDQSTDSATTVAANAKPDTAAIRAQQRAEEAQRLERLRQEALIAAKKMKVKATNFKVGLFGGIKQLQLQLSNPTNLNFTYVVVQVNYIKDGGGLYKTETVYFNHVEPNSSPIQTAPDSDRGTKVTCKVLRYESPDIPQNSDSLATATESLN
ncbi:serine/threonine protein kinase [Spirosoma radiotolerans]|uniref:Serine/threonine protein kinase n=1 Tax=Spirosoma radiotolerans TaxID=1379870 RepID=A0A0E3ZXA7_9BACT|nr:serine/threonine-protein kinase [Spirosoma radiotolerans]AKD56309.1 serine/threonine protein kinase [Spirosoma radiotolerans]